MSRNKTFLAFIFIITISYTPISIDDGNFFPFIMNMLVSSAMAQDNEEAAGNLPLDDTEASPSTEIRKELDGLEEKRLKIQQEEQRLNEQKQYLENLKAEIEEKIESLKQIQKQVEDAVAEKKRIETDDEKRIKAEEEAKLRQLVKVYTSMKPKAAAELINRLDLEVALKLFERMKGDDAGKILTYVNKDLGAQISEGLTHKKNAPQ